MYSVKVLLVHSISNHDEFIGRSAIIYMASMIMVDAKVYYSVGQSSSITQLVGRQLYESAF